MQRALLCGYYGKGNGGDEALLATLLQMLGDRYQPLVLSGNPQATEKLHQVESGDRNSALGIVQSLKRSDVFIWGGGSLMQDTTSLRNPIYYGGLMGLAQKIGLKTVAWAQGIGPLNRPLSQWIAKNTLRNCDRVSVRDNRSAQQLQNWGIDCQIAPDPVWALDSRSFPHLWDSPAPRIAVVWRSHPHLNSNRLNLLIQALISFQKATDAYILLIPFQPSQDGAIAQQIHQALPQKSEIIWETNPRLLKGIFRGVDMAIAMRLHGLIMAAAEGCRCWAISYDPKVSYLMQELEIPGWQLKDLPTDSNSISQAWLEHYVNGEPLSNDRLLSLSDRAYLHQQILQNI
jgi:polysaccharide pyruvyl transferase CsaB